MQSLRWAVHPTSYAESQWLSILISLLSLFGGLGKFSDILSVTCRSQGLGNAAGKAPSAGTCFVAIIPLLQPPDVATKKVHNFFLIFFLMFIYFWDRERQSMNGGGSEREGDTESEAGSRLWAVSTEPDTGLQLTNREIMTWAKVGRLTDWATQAPQLVLTLDILSGTHILFHTLVTNSITATYFKLW